jgi:hypothetical protein
MAAPANESPFRSDGKRAIDRLKAAARLERVKKVVTLSDGSEFEFWCKPLVAAEREQAQKDAGTTETNAFILQLVVSKCTDENGTKLFTIADIPDLKREVREEDLQKVELAMLNPTEALADPKS